MRTLRLLLPFIFLVAIGLSSRWVAPQATIAITRTSIDHGRFKNLSVYRGGATTKTVVLFLSGAGGWDASMDALARPLVQRGAMVVGIDTPQLAADFDADDAPCVFPDGDLENLSHFVQAYYKLPTYLEPILVGSGSGGTLAYASLAQAPQDTFAAAISLDFCPTLAMRKPLCTGSGIDSTPASQGRQLEFLPARHLSKPWFLATTGEAPQCPPAATREFASQVPGATVLQASTPNPAYLAAYDQLAKTADVLAVPPAQLRDLPLVPVAAKPGTRSDRFAVMLSGDGGWAGLDREVAAALAAQGIEVIGVDSLRYFWSARSPQGLADDLHRVIDHYRTALGKPHVLLIGYSQGADVLPFAVNRLPPDSRAAIALVAIMGMSEHALFEFHMSSWVSDDNSGPATLPEVQRIQGLHLVCIYGDGESDSLCPRLQPPIEVVKLKGGHHFDGDYGSLARAILEAAGAHAP